MPRRKQDNYSYARDIILMAVLGLKNGDISARDADVMIKGANALVYSLSQEAGVEFKAEELKQLEELKHKIEEMERCA